MPKYKTKSQCALATNANAGVIRLSDLSSLSDANRGNVGLSVLGAIRLLKAMFAQELSEALTCTLMRRVFDNAHYDQATQRMVFDCSDTPVELDIPGGRLLLNLSDTQPSFEAGVLTLVDQLDQQYGVTYPYLEITTP